MIARSAPLRRGKPLARRTRLRSKGQLRAAGQVASRAASRDPSAAVRALVAGRAGHRCEVCGDIGGGFQLHHRQPRQMGGTRRPQIHSPANLLHLCPACHALVESQRQLAYGNGWLVHTTADPADTPVAVYTRPRPVYLTPDGGYQPTSEGTP